MSNKAVRWVVLPILLFVVAYCAWHFDKYRKIPIQYAINPIWWLRHFEGDDLYDPEHMILYHGNPKYREVAITIDDGPHPQYASGILAVLKQYNVPATFFVVGIKVKQDPAFIKQAIAQGCEIGNHTYDHQRLSFLKPHEIVNELRFDDMIIYKAGGGHPTIMRPPGENYNDKVLHVSKAMGYVTVSWTDAAKDYLKQTPAFIADRVLDRCEPGAIILMHQDYAGTAIALPVIIDSLRSQGYKFVTISTMLAHLGVQPYAKQLGVTNVKPPPSSGLNTLPPPPTVE
jgi:peptidoglycan/xylan/chitin deacetylase (PgdA/CDA1 family)